MNEAKLTDFTIDQLRLYNSLMCHCRDHLLTVTESEKQDINLLITQIVNAQIIKEDREKITMN